MKLKQSDKIRISLNTVHVSGKVFRDVYHVCNGKVLAPAWAFNLPKELAAMPTTETPFSVRYKQILIGDSASTPDYETVFPNWDGEKAEITPVKIEDPDLPRRILQAHDTGEIVGVNPEYLKPFIAAGCTFRFHSSSSPILALLDAEPVGCIMPIATRHGGSLDIDTLAAIVRLHGTGGSA